MEKVFKINVLNKMKSQIFHNKKITKIYCILDKKQFILLLESQNTHYKMFLKEVSNIRTGLVTARKQAKGIENEIFQEYRLLTLRCIKDNGFWDVGFSEPYAAMEELKKDFLSQEGDILVRLSAPYTAALVEKDLVGYVVPSHFAIIRVNESKVAPGYVLWILRQQSTLKQIYQNVSGTIAFGTINSNFFNDLKIDIIPLEKQRLIGSLLKLAEKEQVLLSELAKSKLEFNKLALEKAYKNFKKEVK